MESNFQIQENKLYIIQQYQNSYGLKNSVLKCKNQVFDDYVDTYLTVLKAMKRNYANILYKNFRKEIIQQSLETCIGELNSFQVEEKYDKKFVGICENYSFIDKNKDEQNQNKEDDEDQCLWQFEHIEKQQSIKQQNGQEFKMAVYIKKPKALIDYNKLQNQNQVTTNLQNYNKFYLQYNKDLKSQRDKNSFYLSVKPSHNGTYFNIQNQTNFEPSFLKYNVDKNENQMICTFRIKNNQEEQFPCYNFLLQVHNYYLLKKKQDTLDNEHEFNITYKGQQIIDTKYDTKQKLQVYTIVHKFPSENYLWIVKEYKKKQF